MDITDIEIVRLEPNDWLKYKNIRLETLKQEARAFNSTYEESINYSNEYWSKKLGNDNEIHLFAQFENKIIGTVSATLKEEEVEEGTAVIHGMYLNNSFRSMGIGKLLIYNLLEALKEIRSTKKVKLWVKETQLSATHLYESCGFMFIKKVGEHTLIMEKSMRQ